MFPNCTFNVLYCERISAKKEKIRKNLRLATAFYICYNSGKNRGGLHMKPEKLLEALHTAEKLKDTTRHCYTSKGRHESVAEHSWRIALMAFWLRDEFPQADMDKVIRMCLIHDLGECFTGDIPAFDKTAADAPILPPGRRSHRRTHCHHKPRLACSRRSRTNYIRSRISVGHSAVQADS